MPRAPRMMQRPSTAAGAAQALAGVMRMRNLALDATSYDLRALTRPEIAALGRESAPGAIVVAAPAREARAVGVTVHAGYDAFVAAPGSIVTQFAIAGLGASALGAGALARTVADVTGRPAAGIVAGYGESDLVGEALGGLVLFGAASRVQQARQTLRRRMSEILVEATRGPAAVQELPPAAFATPEVATMVRLMNDPERRLDLLVGHSKGVVSLAAAFARLMRSARNSPRLAPALARAARAQIVTAGAVTAFPEPVRWVHQALGQLDALGRLNSQTDLPHEVVPFAGHHLNTALPLHLDLAAVLRRVLGAT
ncbi:MAG: hypothetical protein AAFN17_04515 [Pseudomonadota bacterium]